MSGCNPLTSAELADLKAKAKADLADDFTHQEIPIETTLRLIAMVERQKAETEKWRDAAHLSACEADSGVGMEELRENNKRQREQIEKLREALAGTVDAIKRDTQEHFGISGYTAARLTDAREALAALIQPPAQKEDRE